MSVNFKKGGVLFSPINHWDLDDGNIVLIYQGSRGENPDLDFIIKYKAPNKRLRTPSHTHWIVDLIIKSELDPNTVCEFINEWIELYDLIEPFDSEIGRAHV